MGNEKSVNEPVGVESVKPVIDHEAAARFLRDELHIDFDNLREIGKAQISRTYSLNVLIEDGRVVAVLDWQDARYGDHVFALMYTLSWLDRSRREVFLNAYKAALKKHGRSEDRLEDRIKCYEYYTGLDGMRFAAKTKDKRFYRGVLDQLTLVDGTY